MATFYLINNVRVGTNQKFAGDLVDDAKEDTGPLLAAGALLWPSSDGVVAAAAAVAVAQKLRGVAPEALESIMQTAANSVQKTNDASEVAATSLVAANLASVATGKGAALVGIEDAGAKFAAVNVEAALAEVKTIADAGMTVQKKTLAITQAAVAAIGAATSGDLNLGSALPANAHVLGAEVAVGTKFQNAGDTDTTKLDVGVGGQTDAFMKDATLKTTGNKGGGGSGYAGQSEGGAQLLAHLHSDVNLSTISAGAATVTVWYYVLP